MTCAVGVGDSTASSPEAGPGASPRAALHDLRVKPVSFRVAKSLLVRALPSLDAGRSLCVAMQGLEREASE